METIEIRIGDRDLTFRVEYHHDTDAGTPWENSDGHGPVSAWTTRRKLPGELVLNSERGRYRYYDFQEACRISLQEGWDAAPYNDGSQTKRQQAAKAAMADFEFLRRWCNDQWHYVGVTVTLLDAEGNETEVFDNLWGVETENDNHHTVARQLADELAHGYGTRWDVVTKQTYAWVA